MMHGLILRDDGQCSRCAHETERARSARTMRLVVGGLLVLLAATAGVRGVSVLRDARAARAAETHARVMALAQSNGTRIVMYTMEGCGACRSAKAWMASRNVTYVERNIDTDPAARDELRGLGRRVLLPTTVIDGEVLVGFRPTAYESALRAHVQ